MEASKPSRQPKPVLQRLYTDAPNPHHPSSPTTASQGHKKAHLKSLHHHRHHHIRHGLNYSKDVVRSAVQLHPPTTFGEALGKGNRNKEPTPTGSSDGSAAASVNALNNTLEERPFRLVSPEDVLRERELAKKREEELRKSLHSLSELSHSTTRRLDDIYYSILEKLHALQSTIASLQGLSNDAKKLYEDFRQDAGEFEQDLKGQIDNFDNFESQQSTLEEFEARIKTGRDRASILSRRLDDARKRVEIWEQREDEWQAKATRRMRLFWTISGGVIILLAAILALHYRSSNSALISTPRLPQREGA